MLRLTIDICKVQNVTSSVLPRSIMSNSDFAHIPHSFLSRTLPAVYNCSGPQNKTKMTHDVEAVWMGKMQFNALVGGHTVVMDAPERAGGEDQGSIPKPFMLTALAGCTGMDVIALLRKADKPLDRFEVHVSGEISKQAPIQYTSVHLIYEMHGDAAHEEDALRVVDRSQNELCGVSAMMKRALPVTWEVTYNGVERFNNKETVAAVA